MADSAGVGAVAQRRADAVGLFYGLGAYLVWGLAPVYFKALKHVPALEIAAHRMVWSVGFLAALVMFHGRLRELLRGPFRWRRAGLYALTASLISLNWLLYIWAVNSDRLIEASLGYFINPLIVVLLGLLFLRERLNRWQTVSVVLAAIGVLWQVVGYGRVPIVSLTLATSFGVYALIRKKARVDPMLGLLIETGLVAPVALAFLVVKGAQGTGSFGAGGAWTTVLLLAAGVITATPLVWFQHAAHRLRLSTVGLLQYLSPTLQFLLAVLFYGEAFNSGHAVTFVFIWASLAIFTADAFRRQRALTRLAQVPAPS